MACEVIREFNGPYRCLSNFFRSPITYEGIEYPGVEWAFQASKSLDPEVRKRICNAETPGGAKSLGRELKYNGMQRTDWFQVNLGIMEELVWLKFTGHEDLKKSLLRTGDAPLIEGNSWGDDWWGMIKVNGILKGNNYLGKILMNVRQNLREGTENWLYRKAS
jgi:ribA/ribD-fused uncharacterized protein